MFQIFTCILGRQLQSGGLSSPTRIDLQLWLSPAAPPAGLRVIAAGPEPIDLAVYDITGRVCYRATTPSPITPCPWKTASGRPASAPFTRAPGCPYHHPATGAWGTP